MALNMPSLNNTLVTDCLHFVSNLKIDSLAIWFVRSKYLGRLLMLGLFLINERIE